MMEIELPDGTIAEFPDNMPQSEIQAVLNRQFGDSDKAAEKKSYSGGILPFSKDGNGEVSFDSNAGIIGAAKRAFMLPGEVFAGKIDPMSDEGRSRAMEMATMVTPASAGVKAGERIIAGTAKSLEKVPPSPPTAEQLMKVGSDGFDAMRDTGATYAPQDVKRVAEAIMAGMNRKGFDDTNSPSTFKNLQRLASPPENSFATISNLHSARKSFGKIGQNFNQPADQHAAAEAIKGLDKFIGLHSKEAAVDGAATGTKEQIARLQAAKLLDESNQNYAAGKRSASIGGLETTAKRRAAAANSGQNLGNSIRSKVASALESPKKVSGFNSKEKATLEKIVEGTKGQNVTRAAGNYLGGGGGLGALSSTAIGAGAGGLVAGPVGAAIGATAAPLAGAGLKRISNAMTEKALKVADRSVRERSPLYEQMLRDAPMTPIPQEKKAMIARLIAAGIIPQEKDRPIPSGQ